MQAFTLPQVPKVHNSFRDSEVPMLLQ